MQHLYEEQTCAELKEIRLEEVAGMREMTTSSRRQVCAPKNKNDLYGKQAAEQMRITFATFYLRQGERSEHR